MGDTAVQQLPAENDHDQVKESSNGTKTNGTAAPDAEKPFKDLLLENMLDKLSVPDEVRPLQCYSAHETLNWLHFLLQTSPRIDVADICSSVVKCNLFTMKHTNAAVNTTRTYSYLEPRKP